MNGQVLETDCFSCEIIKFNAVGVFYAEIFDK